MGLKTNKCCCCPDCLCIVQQIKYTDEHPPEKDWSDETTQRRQLACWDSSVGENGGWYAQFPADGPPCWPSIDVLIELVEQYDGSCALQATVDGETKLSEVDCEGPFGGSWRFDTDDPTNPSLPAEIVIGALPNECGEESCSSPCCLEIPNSLTATVKGYSNDGGPCTDAFDVTLTRNLSTCSLSFSGTATNFPWECEDEGPGFQNLSILFNCLGCVRDENDECYCSQCDGTENPGVTGCGGMLSFILSHPTETDFGSAQNVFAKCGWHTGKPWPSGAFVQSTCDPFYSEFLIPVQGIADCCDVWHIVVTE